MTCRRERRDRALGFCIGLAASLMGVSGGSISTMVLTLYGKPIHAAVGTSAGLGVPITIAGTLGYMLAGLPQQELMPPLTLGFVSLIGVALMAPVSSFTAIYRRRGSRMRCRAASWRSRSGFSCCWYRSDFVGEPDLSRSIAAQHQPVAAHFRALQPVEEAHAEQARAQLPGLRDQRRARRAPRSRRPRSRSSVTGAARVRPFAVSTGTE